MFIGHYGVGMAGKKVDKRPSLGTLFLAAQFLDILWPIFVLSGWEQVEVEPESKQFLTLHFTSYPYSHSLAAAIFWSLVFGVAYFLVKKNFRVSMILGGLVLSHWVLDLIVHVPDLQLVPGISARVGFGVWNFTTVTIIVEGLIFTAGIFLYIKSTKARNIVGSIAFWSLIVFLGVAYVLNLIGPPPPSVKAIGFASLSQLLIIAWAYWADRNRKDVSIESSTVS